MRRLVARPADDADVEAAYADLARQRASGRPYVVVNMVASADGAISIEGRTQAMSSDADRMVFHYLRSLADVILVGAQTVRAERYGPPRIPEDRQRERVARGQAPVPRIAVVSGSLDLDWSSRLFAESPTRPIVFAPLQADPGRLRDAAEVADVLTAGESRVDFAGALGLMADVGLVLCEGGPTLNGELARQDLIDELCLTIAPTLVGGDVGAGLLGRVRLPDLLPMSLVHVLEAEGDLFLRYRRAGGAGGAGTRAAEGVVEPAAQGSQSGEEEETTEAFHGVVADIDYPMLVVTASDGTERSGCLVGFAGQCSIDPPRFMVWISKKNHTYGVARSAEVLTVHLPSCDQHALAEHFGSETGDETDKFAGCAWHEGPFGAVVLDEVTRWFAGRVTETLDTGDHVAFLLEPIAGHVGDDWPGQLGFQAVQDIEPGHGA